MRKIALEEHFSAPGFEKYLNAVASLFEPTVLKTIEKLLSDFDDERIELMDRCEIDLAILSQTAPGVHGESDQQQAVRTARRCNDFLAERISRHSKRYRGFACVALQSPIEAARELERCITELKFVGVLVNGQTGGDYLDNPKFDVFWEKVSELQIPLYLHPGIPYDQSSVFNDRPELNGATWEWTCDTATHALRLVFAGVFDRFPNLKIILGHMGETIPFSLWRLDSRINVSRFAKSIKKPPSQYIREHIMVTTSGVCANGPLLCTVSELGEDNIMFSTDYPYEDADLASRFIEAAPLTSDQREKICFRTAERIFGLKTSSAILR